MGWINNMSTPILQIKGLKKYFPIEKGFIKHTVGNVKAVDGIDFEVNDMETVRVW
jgi:ABC-type oligopeptide transport system ATPase subunit